MQAMQTEPDRTRQTDRHKPDSRQTEDRLTETDRLVARQATDRQTDRQTDGQTDTHAQY